MSEAVFSAILGLAGSGIGSIAGILAANKLIQYRIEQLEKKVDKHNNLIERTYKLEERASVAEEKLNELERKIA